MTADAGFRLRIETEAARKLIAHLADEGHGDDAELRADAIEGETSLHEAIGAVLAQIDECDVLSIGLKAKEAAFADRRAAVERRAEMLRAAIEQAMMATEQDKFILPTATVFISKRKPALLVDNEADIPSEYFIAQPTPAPKLDRKALAEAIAAGRTVPGAKLDNGTVSLTVRRK